MGKPVTLKGHAHVCQMVDPGPRPHVGGPVIETGQTYVTVSGIPIATVTDKTLCSGVPTTAKIVSGSAIANIDGKKIARIGDTCEHGGKLVQGVPWITFE
ncbi:PAAR domain-containing protein [Fulvimarina sp. MAC3]|uniref:PAAR domain-containing protein n=1 Tax=Fulvimarina sp. MAC3 TaxID=3148887 RepID=UPI0031FD849C